MEGTAANELFALLLQLHIAADYFYNVRPLFNFLYEVWEEFLPSNFN